jgi:hypothetical protein
LEEYVHPTFGAIKMPSQFDKNISNSNNSSENQATNNNALVSNIQDDKPDLSIDGMLDISDYIKEVEPNDRTRQAIYAWAVQKQERTKEKILTCIVGLSASTLTATFLMVGIAISNPEVDKQFVKDVIPLILTPQITLLSGSFGAYILHTRSKNKK